MRLGQGAGQSHGRLVQEAGDTGVGGQVPPQICVWGRGLIQAAHCALRAPRPGPGDDVPPAHPAAAGAVVALSCAVCCCQAYRGCRGGAGLLREGQQGRQP